MGSPRGRERRALEERVAVLPVLKLDGLRSFEAAADLWRTCRHGGYTVRTLLDCLVAVIDAGAQLLHDDRDFEAIARHSELRIHPLDAPRPDR